MMLAHYNRMLKDSERRIEHSLKIQVHEDGVFKGGFVDDSGLVHSKYAIYRITSAIAVYCNEESDYYHKSEVYDMICLGLQYVMRTQHKNGLFDLISCNFFSAPDTAFCVKRLLPYLKYLDKNRTTAEEETIYQAVTQITEKAAKGLQLGGFHTPNHRWAIASNLMA
ncbi:MAG: hypothetical protein RR593_09570, partial [Hungatella sp.]